MRLFIVIDETVFFHPEFLDDLIKKTNDIVVGAAVVMRVPKKNNIERYMTSHFWYLRPSEIAKLSWRKAKLKIMSFDRKPHSVREVFKKYGIGFLEVRNNINDVNVLSYIRNFEPDVIISSQSLIFEDELLSIPKKCCLNRHSGLLPRNGGLWPGFQAIRKGESETGVSVHTMERKIDAGIVLSQIRVPICESETVWEIYRRCFEKSADAILMALEKIRNNDYSPVDRGLEREYYSFPTKEQWKEFRRRKGRYV